ncbi:MAG: alpha/beta fold hydrolase [Chthoniobacteraceae bacterium]
MNLPPRVTALLTAFCLCIAVLPLGGCSRYSLVSQRHPRFTPATPEGRALSRALDTRANSATLLGCSLDCAASAAQRLHVRPGDAKAKAEYNFAVSRVFDVLRDTKLHPWESPIVARGSGGDWQLTFNDGMHAEMEPGKIAMLPADRFAFRGTYVKTHTLKDGLGAPLIVTGREHEFRQAEGFSQGRRVYYGMTGLLRFEGRKCILTTEDPLAIENVKLDGRTFPLAADFTAPLALALSKEKPFLVGLERLLRPQKFSHTARIARLQPYDRAKIPVICVHGLLDSPVTWVPLINAMRGDAAIRQRYQFWFYSYPSGYPYPHSAAIMREHLDAINVLYPGHKKEILIGHSMGGIISRTMITDSGMKIWNSYFETPPDQLAISPWSEKILSDSLIFRHRPEIARVIFISSPHRGSDLAAGWLGRLGSLLVKAPAYLLHIGEETRNLTSLDPASMRLRFMPNSIENLTPDDPFAKAINTLPITPGIPYHSIMGDRGKGGNKDHTKPVSSDGFVPYWSSHLDGAKSELIVPSGHSAHQNVQAIEEVRRILRQDVR